LVVTECVSEQSTSTSFTTTVLKTTDEQPSVEIVPTSTDGMARIILFTFKFSFTFYSFIQTRDVLSSVFRGSLCHAPLWAVAKKWNAVYGITLIL